MKRKKWNSVIIIPQSGSRARSNTNEVTFKFLPRRSEGSNELVFSSVAHINPGMSFATFCLEERKIRISGERKTQATTKNFKGSNKSPTVWM
jgi:hypothetical protein